MTAKDQPADPASQQPARSPNACPICARPAAASFAPFCSRRCADVDLNRWLGGVSRIPAAPEDEAPPEPE